MIAVRGLLVIIILVEALILDLASASNPPPSRQSRLTVFISDLHLGVGRDTTGTWYPFEDFRWEKEFLLFLDEINRQGAGATDLIFNGDTFELWQTIRPDDCRYDGNYDLGCTEANALDRLRRVLTTHSTELKAIGRFANSGDNRVIIVPGNHDAALLFPKVARAALDSIPSNPGRVHIASEGYWLSPDHIIYAEHGNQIGKEVNRFDNWPSPFIDNGGQKHLQRPWGEQFVQEYYNKWEEAYPIIDNIADEGVGVHYGIAAEGIVAATAATAGFLKFALLQVSWAQFGQSLGEEGTEIPQWDIKKIRQQGNTFLRESLPEDDPLRAVLERALAKGTVEFSQLHLDDDDIRLICDRRAGLRKMQKQPTVTECPRTKEKLGAIVEYLFRSRDAIYGEYLKHTFDRLSKAGKSTRRFMVFIYSHTHRADSGFRPLEKLAPSWNPLVMNTGAWQRVIPAEELDKWKNQNHMTDADVLRKKTLEDLPACYSVIIVKPYSERPAPMLKYWRATEGTKWGLSETCN